MCLGGCGRAGQKRRSSSEFQRDPGDCDGERGQHVRTIALVKTPGMEQGGGKEVSSHVPKSLRNEAAWLGGQQAAGWRRGKQMSVE